MKVGLLLMVTRPLRQQILVTHIKKKSYMKNTVEPGYNEIGLCDILTALVV